MGHSALLALVLQLGASGATAFCAIPICKEIQLIASPRTNVDARRRLLHSEPMIRRAGRRTLTMEDREDFEQLDGVIPRTPETIGTVPLEQDGGTETTPSSLTDYANELLWPSLNSSDGGGGGDNDRRSSKSIGTRSSVHPIFPTSGAFNTRNGIHPIFPTRGSFNFGALTETTDPLPGCSLEPEAKSSAATGAPPSATSRDHAASVAEEIAQKVAEGSGLASLPIDADAESRGTPFNFRAAAPRSVAEHAQSRERRAKATRPSRGRAGIDTTRVPNLWLVVAHSSSVKAGGVTKVEVDGVPIALWRSATGVVSAMSDVCIHRGASLARGWITSDRLVCPYHGFEYERNGCLAYVPVAGPPTASPAAAAAAAKALAKAGRGAIASAATTPSPCEGIKAPTFPVHEVGGWIYIFPDSTRPGAVEQRIPPVAIPEAVSPEFRAVEGSIYIKGGVDACVENLLDMLHISFVHSFGNTKNPAPVDVRYEQGFDDPGSDAMATSRVTFRFRSGRRTFSKIVGSTELVVKNEFHLPYRTVVRVYFGKNSVKTIEATTVPRADGETMILWKLYRNFAISHPLDEGPINKAVDFLVKHVMESVLKEDKGVIESIYPQYQQGFMNVRYDKHVLQYRKAITRFQATAAERAKSQVESSLQMELLSRISRNQRGLASDRSDRAAILGLIQRLENIPVASSSSPSPSSLARTSSANTPAAAAAAAFGVEASQNILEVEGATTAAAVKAPTAAVTTVDTLIAGRSPSTIAPSESVEGEWHLGYVLPADEDLGGWDLVGATGAEKMERTAALREAGGEARLFDWNENGRPLWADTIESVQIIDTKAKTLINRAVYKGWSGFTTTVQLDAVIEPLGNKTNRVMVGFHKAIVNVGGIKVTFPHLQRFSPMGWMETTYLNQGIRIVRGNKGSIFVLTRQPVSPISPSSDQFGSRDAITHDAAAGAP